MNTTNRMQRPRLIYWVHLVLLIPALIAFIYLLVDLALHLRLAETDTAGNVLMRGIAGLVIAPLTVGVGLLCIRRSPGNIVGAILALWGCGTAMILNPHSNDWPPALQIFNTAYAGVIWPACFFLFWYFPDGRVYPPRLQKGMDWLVLITYGAGLLIGLTSPMTSRQTDVNPLYMPILASLNGVITAVNGAGAAVGLLGGLVSLVLRYRAADTRVRQQMKWLVWSVAPLVSLVLVQISLLVSLLATSEVTDWLGNMLQLALFVVPVVAIGNAILRHNLYDIDIIIRRTLIYSVLTVALAAIYFGGVVVVQQVLRPLTESSDLAIVVSTLAIAALFNPLRHRIQNTIDRRFFRRKYDAQKTLEAFSIATRDEVDLDKLQAELVGVVQETMQPARIMLWVPDSQIGEKSS